MILELTSGSTTTTEFSELCKVLRINPPVNKYRKYQSKKPGSLNRDAGKYINTKYVKYINITPQSNLVGYKC